MTAAVGQEALQHLARIYSAVGLTVEVATMAVMAITRK
jgi:hypothetical protein